MQDNSLSSPSFDLYWCLRSLAVVLPASSKRCCRPRFRHQPMADLGCYYCLCSCCYKPPSPHHWSQCCLSLLEDYWCWWRWARDCQKRYWVQSAQLALLQFLCQFQCRAFACICRSRREQLQLVICYPGWQCLTQEWSLCMLHDFRGSLLRCQRI